MIKILNFIKNIILFCLIPVGFIFYFVYTSWKFITQFHNLVAYWSVMRRKLAEEVAYEACLKESEL